MDKINSNNVSKFSGAHLEFLNRLNQNALNNQQTLSFYEKNGFHSFFKSEEQEAEKVRLKLPLKTRYLYFDLINII